MENTKDAGAGGNPSVEAAKASPGRVDLIALRLRRAAEEQGPPGGQTQFRRRVRLADPPSGRAGAGLVRARTRGCRASAGAQRAGRPPGPGRGPKSSSSAGTPHRPSMEAPTLRGQAWLRRLQPRLGGPAAEVAAGEPEAAPAGAAGPRHPEAAADVTAGPALPGKVSCPSPSPPHPRCSGGQSGLLSPALNSWQHGRWFATGNKT
ncbi:collagen, type I, alpha 1a-like [Cavia porcellus]|uniref:collagen, type I, alpha 1a-like n=1 Tax=Cavia porcellus TaxID=10141 RepID=UPI002FE0FA98